MPRVRRSFRVIALLLAPGLLLAGERDAAAEPATCSLGRFVVQGKGLFAGVHRPGRGPRAAGDVATNATVIALAGGKVAIAGTCTPTTVLLAPADGGTEVKAAWAHCAGVPGPVRLRGAISADGCQTFVGRIEAKRGRLRRRFRARRSGGDPGACIEDSTFDQIQQRIFGPRGCRVEACHGSGRAGGLDLRYGKAPLALIDVAATNATAAAAGKRRVVPGDPDASFLWRKLGGRLQPDEGGRMPEVGRPLDALELELVRAWIEGGAPVSGQVAGAPCLPQEEYQPAPALTPPPDGYQIAFDGPTLQPGEELEGCVWVQVPNAEDFVVGWWEYSLNPGAHHFGIWDHVYGDPPELNVFKRDFGCRAGGARPDGVAVSAGEAPYYVDAYPAGVGKVVQGGSLLGLDPHYHNDFDVPIEIKVWTNIYPYDGPRPPHIAQTIIALEDTFRINVPPFTQVIQHGRWRNNTGAPFQIIGVAGHMHKRGLRFTAWQSDHTSQSDGTKMYESFDWAHPGGRAYDPPYVLAPGDWIAYECLHDNGVTREVKRDELGQPTTLNFGVTTDDEMCILTGAYYVD